MAQMTLDLKAALAARDAGVQKTASKNATFIETMRGVARLICQRKGTVTADDLKEWLANNPGMVDAPTHYNAWGAVFCNPEWRKEFEFVGFIKSRQVQGHGNLIRQWKQKGHP